MIQMRFGAAPISCPLHPERQGGLGDSPFNASLAFVAFLKEPRLLALPSRLHGQVLRVRMQGQLAWAGFATSTARPGFTGGTDLFGKQHLHRRFAARPFGRFPGLALLPHGAGDALMIPVNKKVADILRVLIVRLPALILAHRTGEVKLIVVLIASRAVPRRSKRHRLLKCCSNGAMESL
jgi:hypothetical protein